MVLWQNIQSGATAKASVVQVGAAGSKGGAGRDEFRSDPITFLGCKSLKVILNMVNDVHNKWTHEIRIIKHKVVELIKIMKKHNG